MAIYTYTLSTVFPNAPTGPLPQTLHKEIITALPAKQLQYVRTDVEGDLLTVAFVDTLTAGEQTTLQAVLTAHTGIAPLSGPDEGRIIAVSFGAQARGTHNYLGDKTTYYAARRIIWPCNMPCTKVKILGWMSAAGVTGFVKVFSLTTGLTILEKQIPSNVTPSITIIGPTDINNVLETGDAWEIQAKSSSTFYLSSMLFVEG